MFVGWARLRRAAPCELELGAWYPVTAATAREARVLVRGRAITVSRSLVELRSTPPQEWTVVRSPRVASRAIQDLEVQLVCPSCRQATSLSDRATPALRCPRCNNLFPIAWNEPYPVTRGDAAISLSIGATKQVLMPDRRKMARRKPRERRTGEQRRGAGRESGTATRRERERRQPLERRAKPTVW